MIVILQATIVRVSVRAMTDAMTLIAVVGALETFHHLHLHHHQEEEEIAFHQHLFSLWKMEILS